VAWPLAARAQQASKLPTIGLLGSSTPSAMRQWVAAFVQRLRELGWIEGRTIGIEYRGAEGRSERFAEIAAEFVRLKVDVIVTYASPPVLAPRGDAEGIEGGVADATVQQCGRSLSQRAISLSLCLFAAVNCRPLKIASRSGQWLNIDQRFAQKMPRRLPCL
jgi:hypothetical protein